jgi:hypothetical protein
MFRRKAASQVEHINVTRIELSDESRQALVGLDNDIQTLREFMREVSDKASSILATLHGEIAMQVPTYTAPEPSVGVKVFDDEGRVELPGAMSQERSRGRSCPRGGSRPRNSVHSRSAPHTGRVVAEGHGGRSLVCGHRHRTRVRNRRAALPLYARRPRPAVARDARGGHRGTARLAREGQHVRVSACQDGALAVPLLRYKSKNFRADALSVIDEANDILRFS